MLFSFRSDHDIKTRDGEKKRNAKKQSVLLKSDYSHWQRRVQLAAAAAAERLVIPEHDGEGLNTYVAGCTVRLNCSRLIGRIWSRVYPLSSHVPLLLRVLFFFNFAYFHFDVRCTPFAALTMRTPVCCACHSRNRFITRCSSDASYHIYLEF